jgi:hypothetical protein
LAGEKFLTPLPESQIENGNRLKVVLKKYSGAKFLERPFWGPFLKIWGGDERLMALSLVARASDGNDQDHTAAGHCIENRLSEA